MYDALRELYEDLILDHNRNPRNYPIKPEGTNHSAHGFNSLCGDEFHVHLKIADGRIEDIGFEGAGCAISTASSSLMTEAVKGMKVEDAETLFTHVHEILTEEQVRDDKQDLLGKLSVLIGVKEYPLRVKCATLIWHTLHAAINKEQGIISTDD
ncbi:MAG: SUF system NifU family Fe-S cluster assembly protein [Arenicellales bacterium]|jgi:nitrogen fixation NifU-like protein|nr:SUF system NifU family Fe-S cluster assembly protein [Acidiferrobacteraceae bacterium]MDP6289329.1 SUF system NifU family Fe-S cluster assembly protein [Arenicellales bacterium]MDP7155300.1 SUF system NifU family Fe-S cluster assembly protein [Arenicellales bacterium]MDP7283197.1 SUF system NifU family Fe-S cluster assembly protein [Arenicellales bacterium]MDP7481911.1 SUF system NifU family Fe-S cluster assembly protein [Arenicellales bacterium]|tara:strand:+ start:1389 stop:1850 length:462 start_codon:yes stop_codon:yes gene_type:complete